MAAVILLMPPSRRPIRPGGGSFTPPSFPISLDLGWDHGGSENSIDGSSPISWWGLRIWQSVHE
ncbi:hypothetical protein PVAP13_5KG583900 [Panicum virgatum]|uniref:Uncharacterized protein n=1 Tax=Panicum virgatum TaxID=38727 RepID=A0A8T0SWC1_PANVG|nr:hypothetical protein PVAP13_5KG583900 [Panicum virgatum]